MNYEIQKCSMNPGTCLIEHHTCPIRNTKCKSGLRIVKEDHFLFLYDIRKYLVLIEERLDIIDQEN